MPVGSGGTTRRGQRLHPRLLEPRLSPGLETVGGQQPGVAVLRVLDERLRGRLAAALVDGFGLQGDVHGEQLAGVDAGQRDLEAARLTEVHHPCRAGSAVVGVAVDVELRLVP